MINEMYLATRTRTEPPRSNPNDSTTELSGLSRRPHRFEGVENQIHRSPCERSGRLESCSPQSTEESSSETTPSENEWLPKVAELVNTVVDKLLNTINQLTEKLSAVSTANQAASAASTSPSQPTTAPTSTATQPATTTTTPSTSTPPANSTESATQTPANTTQLKKSGQFLWKPVSEKDGKLAILLPPNLTGKVTRVKILDKDGKTLLGAGHYSGVGNGDREHYRFNKAGGKYPAGSIVDIVLKDGSHRRVTIEKPGERVTR